MIIKKGVITWLVLALFLSSICINTGCTVEKKPKSIITVYTSLSEDTIDLIRTSLRVQFPNYEINFEIASDLTLQQKISEEQNLKQLGCDIIIAADPTYALQLQEKNMLHNYSSTEQSNIAIPFSGDDYWYPLCYTNMVIGYNPDLYQKQELPNSYYSFAHQNTVNTSCSMSNPATTASTLALISALKDMYGYSYFDALATLSLTIEPNSVALTKLESGECRTALVTEDAIIKKRQLENSKLDVIYPLDGVVTIPVPIMIISDDWSANKNAKKCEVLVDWFLSKEGQEFITGSYLFPVRADVTSFNEMQDQKINSLSNLSSANWENCFLQKDELLNRFEQTIPFSNKTP